MESDDAPGAAHTGADPAPPAPPPLSMMGVLGEMSAGSPTATSAGPVGFSFGAQATAPSPAASRPSLERGASQQLIRIKRKRNQEPMDALRLFTSKRAHTTAGALSVAFGEQPGTDAGAGVGAAGATMVFQRLGEIDAHTSLDSDVVQKALQQKLRTIRSAKSRFAAPRFAHDEDRVGLKSRRPQQADVSASRRDRQGRARAATRQGTFALNRTKPEAQLQEQPRQSGGFQVFDLNQAGGFAPAPSASAASSSSAPASASQGQQKPAGAKRKAKGDTAEPAIDFEEIERKIRESASVITCNDQVATVTRTPEKKPARTTHNAGPPAADSLATTHELAAALPTATAPSEGEGGGGKGGKGANAEEEYVYDVYAANVDDDGVVPSIDEFTVFEMEELIYDDG